MQNHPSLLKPEDALTDCMTLVTDFCINFSEFIEYDTTPSDIGEFTHDGMEYLTDVGFSLHDIISATDAIADDEDILEEIGRDTAFRSLGYLKIFCQKELSDVQQSSAIDRLQSAIDKETAFLRRLVTPNLRSTCLFIRPLELNGQGIASIALNGQKYHIICDSPREAFEELYRFLRFKNRRIMPDDLKNPRKMFESITAQPHSDGIFWLRRVLRRKLQSVGQLPSEARFYNVVL